MRICPDCGARELDKRYRYCADCGEARRYISITMAVHTYRQKESYKKAHAEYEKKYRQTESNKEWRKKYQKEYRRNHAY